MTLKSPSGDEMIPIAYISMDWCKPGYLVLQKEGGRFRTAFSIPVLLKCNPPEIVEGYMHNLNDDFFNWITEQERKYNNGDKDSYNWQNGDIPPFWFPPEEGFSSLLVPDNYVNQPDDTRKEEDYLEIKAGPVRSPRHTSRGRKQ